MTQILTICVAVLLGYSNASLIQPRDLAEEAKHQLQQLKSTVQGHIYVAHEDLDTLSYEFKNSQMGIISSVRITIDRHHHYSVKYQLNSWIDLAENAGYDVTPCTDVHQQTLNSMPSRYINGAAMCTQTIYEEAVKAAGDARYVVDIIMTKVYDLENQLIRCREDILCISPLITEIELNKVRMPQNIRTEVLATESLFTTMTLSLQECRSSHVAEYTEKSSALMAEIRPCIDEIMA